tara:strand:- start:139 stop:615 length:477 start_codon:yes stop_codon:yes gene_type:complete
MGQKSIHEFKFTSIDGAEVSFSDFLGKKILIVNTASKCGFTPQYVDLEELHKQYKDNLVIVGFPANNFGGQEPGSNEEIASFCKKNYGVSFLMAEKVSVNGSDIHPIFAWLNEQENPDFKGDVKWNFEKYLLDENGILIHRYRSMTKSNSKKVTENIE